MKIGFLITARLKSSRLPLKLIKPLGDRKVVEHVIDRIKEIKDIETIVLCTSTNHQDLPLVDISRENNIYYFNGNEEDVLQRLLDAAKLYGLDYMIGITGENPLFSLEGTKQVIKEVRTNHYDFIHSTGLPIGCATYGIRIKALETVCAIKKVVDTEIWGYLINRPEIFNIKSIEVDAALNWPDLRITIDYPEDYEFVKSIFDKINADERKQLATVLRFLKEHPEIVAIHADRKQLDLDETVKKEINDFFVNQKAEILAIKNKIYQ